MNTYIYVYIHIYIYNPNRNACTRSLARIATADAIGKQDTIPQLLSRNVKRFRRGLVFKAHRLVHHSTLGWRVIKKKKWTALSG